MDAAAFDSLLGLLRYVGGDYTHPATFARLREALGAATRPFRYPGDSVELLFDRGLGSRRERVRAKRPSGGGETLRRDLASARELNEVLHRFFPEQAIFRIDHFLGKEPVHNLLYFRFANAFLEPIWNREHIESVQTPWPRNSA